VLQWQRLLVMLKLTTKYSHVGERNVRTQWSKDSVLGSEKSTNLSTNGVKVACPKVDGGDVTSAE
jgi:hypothetical protein